jgi:N-ethylmaleimide reductase
MAPMTREADNEGNVPTDELHGLYYEQRASAGLIITEGSQRSLCCGLYQLVFTQMSK